MQHAKYNQGARGQHGGSQESGAAASAPLATSQGPVVTRASALSCYDSDQKRHARQELMEGTIGLCCSLVDNVDTDFLEKDSIKLCPI